MVYKFVSQVDNVAGLTAYDSLKKLGIGSVDFYGNPAVVPAVIGGMPAAMVYFRDRGVHSLEYIYLLDQALDPEFEVQVLSHWLDRLH